MGAKKGAKGAKKEVKPSWRLTFPLYQKKDRNFSIGNDILPKNRDLTRFVKWPKRVRIQRQKKILQERLKVPPAIAQFKRVLPKNNGMFASTTNLTTSKSAYTRFLLHIPSSLHVPILTHITALQLFTLLHKYRPETKLQKKQRLTKLAEAKSKGESLATIKRPLGVISGINHVTSLIESDRAKLVVIADDVDPVEVCLPPPTTLPLSPLALSLLDANIWFRSCYGFPLFAARRTSPT